MAGVALAVPIFEVAVCGYHRRSIDGSDAAFMHRCGKGE